MVDCKRKYKINPANMDVPKRPSHFSNFDNRGRSVGLVWAFASVIVFMPRRLSNERPASTF
jgi:hypothetical protein